MLQNTNQFKGIAIAHPVVDQRIIAEFFRHVGEGNEIVVAARHDGDSGTLDLYSAFLCFAQAVCHSGLNASKPLEFEGIKYGKFATIGLEH